MADENFSPDEDTLEAAIKKGIAPSDSLSFKNPSSKVQSTSNENISLAREWGWQAGGFRVLAREWGWQAGGFGVTDIPNDITEAIGLDTFQPAREWGWWEGSSPSITIAREWGWEAGGWG